MFVSVKARGEQNLWTVGYYIHDDEGNPVWTAMRDFSHAETAWAFINYLNGGDGKVWKRFD